MKKQRDWIMNLVNELETRLTGKQVSIKTVLLQELTNQPYCGQFLAYQLFEESSAADELLIKKALKNCTDFDFIQYMLQEDIADAEEFFDMNKLLQLREKFTDHSV